MMKSISIIIPTFNSAQTLEATLSSIFSNGLGTEVEVLIVDGYSEDETWGIASSFGAKLVVASRGRGIQLAKGAEEAKGEWLLFLHADTILTPKCWEDLVQFIDTDKNLQQVAIFHLSLADIAVRARFLEWIVRLRTKFLGLPYGDQGLFIHRKLYTSIGGFKDLALMEDVDIARRIGRQRFVLLDSKVTTSAIRYKKHGYLLRILRNVFCLALFYMGVKNSFIVRIYG